MQSFSGLCFFGAFWVILGMGSCFNLTIFHTNGIRSRWYGTDANGGSIESYEKAPYGGFLRLKMTLGSEKMRCESNRHHFLNLNAGDTFSGTPEFKVIGDANPKHAGQLTGKFMKSLGFDAMCPGAHEFDLGIEGLTAFLEVAGLNSSDTRLYLVDDGAYCYKNESDFHSDVSNKWTNINFEDHTSYKTVLRMPIFVAANFLEGNYYSVVSKNTKQSMVRMRRSVVRIFNTTEGKNVPVGIIGYITQDVKHMRQTQLNDLDKGKLIIGCPLTYVKKEVERLNHMGVKIIIVLGSSEEQMDIKIALLPGVTAVIRGSSYNKFMYNPNVERECNPNQAIPVYPTLIPRTSQNGVIVGFTPIAQIYQFGKHLGKLQMEFDASGKLLLSDYSNPQLAQATFTDNLQNPILLNSQFKKGKVMVSLSNQSSEDPTAPQTNAIELVAYKKLTDLLDEWQKEYLSGVQQFMTQNTIPSLTITKFIEGGAICRERECKLGGHVADSHLNWYASVKGKISADAKLFPQALGVINAGAITGHIGDVFVSSTTPKTVNSYEIMEILNGKSAVVIVRMSQAQVIEMFKCSITQWENSFPTGRLLQVSNNVRVKYDFALTSRESYNLENKQITIPKVKVEVFNGHTYEDISEIQFENTLFDVVTTENLADGGSKYSMIKNGTRLPLSECPWKIFGDYLPQVNPKKYQYRMQFRQ